MPAPEHFGIEQDGDGGAHTGLRAATNFRPGTGRRLQLLAASVAIVLLVGFFVVHHWRADAEHRLAENAAKNGLAAPAVIAIAAETAPGVQHLSLPGETFAWYESTIYARVNGYVAKWFVDIGDRVQKGQVLALIDTPELDAELTAARAKLRSAETQVKLREAEADFAKTTYDRWRGSPKGVVSEQERESKKADFASAEARLNTARAQVNIDQANVDRLTALTEFKQVVAPYEGIIIERRIDIGNLVTAGSTANTSPLYRMSQNDPMRVFVSVPQSAAPDMVTGLPAKVSSGDLPERSFQAAITRTARAINPRARTLRVEVDLANTDGALLPGMYVTVDFQLKAKGLVQVPAAGMVFRGQGPQVAVVGSDGVVKLRDVRIARDDGNVVEIDSGVAPGEKIVLNISNQIADGDKVTVNDASEGLASTAKLAR